MKLITANDSGAVVFAFNDDADVKLGAHLESPIICFDVSDETHQVVDAPDNPEFVGGYWKFDNQGWSLISVVEWDKYLASLQEAPIVPQTVFMYQLRLALHKKGLLSAFLSALDSLPEPDRTLAHIEFEYKPDEIRVGGLLDRMANAMQLSVGDVDEIFFVASIA